MRPCVLRPAAVNPREHAPGACARSGEVIDGTLEPVVIGVYCDREQHQAEYPVTLGECAQLVVREVARRRHERPAGSGVHERGRCRARLAHEPSRRDFDHMVDDPVTHREQTVVQIDTAACVVRHDLEPVAHCRAFGRGAYVDVAVFLVQLMQIQLRPADDRPVTSVGMIVGG